MKDQKLSNCILYNKKSLECDSVNIKEMLPMVGNTPLLKVAFTYKGKSGAVFAKAEYYNLTGSIKDRVAMHVLAEAYKNGEIMPGDRIVEATSGNTGISFAAIGRALGHPITIYMPDWMTKERIIIMESFGAEVKLVSKEEGGFLGSVARAEEEGKKPHVFLPRQFSNPQNVSAHYLQTGLEIQTQLQSIGLRADGFVAGVGTGGTVMGVGQRLREGNPDCLVCPLEPENSPTLSTGYKVGQHRIYGISDEFIPDILDLETLDHVVSVDDGDAIIMARMLSETLGIGVGVSSGANLLGAIQLWEKTGGTIVTVFADDNKKYLSTDYAKTQDKTAGKMSQHVALSGFTAYR